MNMVAGRTRDGMTVGSSWRPHGPVSGEDVVDVLALRNPARGELEGEVNVIFHCGDLESL